MHREVATLNRQLDVCELGKTVGIPSKYGVSAGEAVCVLSRSSELRFRLRSVMVDRTKVSKLTTCRNAEHDSVLHWHNFAGKSVHEYETKTDFLQALARHHLPKAGAQCSGTRRRDSARLCEADMYTLEHAPCLISTPTAAPICDCSSYICFATAPLARFLR